MVTSKHGKLCGAIINNGYSSFNYCMKVSSIFVFEDCANYTRCIPLVVHSKHCRMSTRLPAKRGAYPRLQDGLVHSGTNGWTQLCILDATNNEGVHKYVNIEYQVSRASEVNGQGAVRSATYELLLVVHSNRGRISKRFVTIHDFHLSFLPALFTCSVDMHCKHAAICILIKLSGPLRLRRSGIIFVTF